MMINEIPLYMLDGNMSWSVVVSDGGRLHEVVTEGVADGVVVRDPAGRWVYRVRRDAAAIERAMRRVLGGGRCRRRGRMEVPVPLVVRQMVYRGSGVEWHAAG